MNFLEDLLHPFSQQEFFNTYWSRAILHISRNDSSYFERYLSLTAIEEWLTYTNLKHPTVQLEYNGRKSPDEWTNQYFHHHYSDGRIVEKHRLKKLFSDGYSILVKDFSSSVFMPELAKAMVQLRDFFTGVLEDNLIISYPNQPAFTKHYDKEHVFAFQLSGEKEWSFFETYANHLRGEQVHFPLSFPSKKTVLMQAGDVLYIPPCLNHQTKTIGESPSISISISIDLPNGLDFLHQIVKQSYVNYPELRQMMPHPLANTTEKEAFEKTIKSLFLKYFETVSFDNIFEEIHAIHHSKNQLVEPLRQYQDSSKLSLETRLSKATNEKLQLLKDGKTLRLKFGLHILNYFIIHQTSFNFIINQQDFLVKDIPGMLNKDMKIKLVQQLVNIGYLKIAP